MIKSSETGPTGVASGAAIKPVGLGEGPAEGSRAGRVEVANEGASEAREAGQKRAPPSAKPARRRQNQSGPPRFAAIDLGTNNCRLLIGTPHKKSFRVVDAYSQIVRLGEGVSQAGALSQGAMDRTIEALKICAGKIVQRRVVATRAIATQACRAAENGEEFLRRIRTETGLQIDTITTEEEATLAVQGCHDLIDPTAKAVLVFDIGGGSTEISWVRPGPRRRGPRGRSGGSRRRPRPKLVAWTSLPFGVVTMAEKFGGKDISRELYNEMIEYVAGELRKFDGAARMKEFFENGQAHLLGTSGTVTSIAGVELKLKRYNRRFIDGIWLSDEKVLTVSEHLRAIGFEGRTKEPCIGQERADLVVPGCAILEGIMREWPATRIRVADRGLREGMIQNLMAEDRQKRRQSARSQS
ncbi:MAG: Ppx/GppA phosphatase family protein [Parvularculaceae bacterium]